LENKKIYTCDELTQLLQKSAEVMAANEILLHDTLEVLMGTKHYGWIRETSWIGKPVLKVLQDMFVSLDVMIKTQLFEVS
jgi:hypothetical protein